MEFKKLKRFTFVFGFCIGSCRASKDPKEATATKDAEEWPEEVLEYKRPTIKAIFDPKKPEPRIECTTSLDVKSRRICRHLEVSSIAATVLHFLLYSQAFMPKFAYALERFCWHGAMRSVKARIPPEKLSEILPLVKAIFINSPMNISGHDLDEAIKTAFTISTQIGPNKEDMSGLFMHGISSGLSNLLEYSNVTALFVVILLAFFAPTVIGAICSYFEDGLNDMAKCLQRKGVLEVEEGVRESTDKDEKPPSEEYLDLVKLLEDLLFQYFKSPLSVVKIITFPFRVVQEIFSWLYYLLYFPGMLLYGVCYYLLRFVGGTLNFYIEIFREIIQMLFGDFFTIPPSYYKIVSHVVEDEAYKKLMRKSAAFYTQVSSGELVSAFQFLGKQMVEREQNLNLQAAEFYRILSYIAYIYPLLGWKHSVHEIEMQPILQMVIAIISIGILYSNYNKISEETRGMIEAMTLAKERQRNDITEVLGMSYMAIPDYECERYAAFKEENDRKKLQLAIAQQKMDNYLTFFKFAFTCLSMVTILLTQQGVVGDTIHFISNWNRFFNKLSVTDSASFLESFVFDEKNQTAANGERGIFVNKLTELVQKITKANPQELDSIKQWGNFEDIDKSYASVLQIMQKVSQKDDLWASAANIESINNKKIMIEAIKTAFSEGVASPANQGALIQKIADAWRCNQLNQEITNANEKIGTIAYMLVLCGGMFYVYSSLTDSLARKLTLEQEAEDLRLKIRGHHNLVSCPSSESPVGKKLKSHEGTMWAIMPQGFTYKPIQLKRTGGEVLSTEEVTEGLKEAVNFIQKTGGVASIKIELSESISGAQTLSEGKVLNTLTEPELIKS